MSPTWQGGEMSPAVPRRWNILWVEDNDDVWGGIAMILQDARPDLALTRATTGHRALRLLQPACFDLVVTDILHPGPSGYELVRWIKLNQPTVPVIVFAGFYAGGKELQYARSLGALACIPKGSQGWMNLLLAAINGIQFVPHLEGAYAPIPPATPLPSSPPPRFAVAHVGHGVPANKERERAAILAAIGSGVMMLDDCGSIVGPLEAAAGPFILLSDIPEASELPCGYWEESCHDPGDGDGEELDSDLRRQLAWHRTGSMPNYFFWLLSRYPQLELHIHTVLTESELPAAELANSGRIWLHRLNVWGDYVRELAEIARVCATRVAPRISPADDMKAL